MKSLLVIYVIFGGLLVGLSFPLLQGKVPPNGWYGFRVPSTLNNPDIWYKANRYAARWLLLTGIVTILSAVALYFVPGLTVDTYAWLCLGAFVVVFLPGLVLSFRHLRRLTR